MCDDRFNDIAAEAICLYMEYSYSIGWTSAKDITEFRETLEITLDDVECSSAYWNSCTFSEKNDCGHGEDVFLTCGKDAEDASGEEPFPKCIMFHKKQSYQKKRCFNLQHLTYFEVIVKTFNDADG